MKIIKVNTVVHTQAKVLSKLQLFIASLFSIPVYKYYYHSLDAEYDCPGALMNNDIVSLTNGDAYRVLKTSGRSIVLESMGYEPRRKDYKDFLGAHLITKSRNYVEQ